GYTTWVAEVTLEPGKTNILNITAVDSLGNTGTDMPGVKVQQSEDLSIAFPDDQIPFAEPQTVAVDAKRSRALVVDVEKRAIYTVDLATGVRSVLSENKEGDEYPLLLERADFNYAGITVDSKNDVAYVGSSTNSPLTTGPTVLVVKMDTGARNAASKSLTSLVSQLAFNIDNGKVYLGSFFDGLFAAVDPIAKED